MRKQLLAIFITAFLGFSSSGFSCDDYCGWSGLYSTGDYNAYSFGVDLYTVIDYAYIPSYSNDSWGGSCGSFMTSCGSSYDRATLYPQNTTLENSLIALTTSMYYTLNGMNNGTYPPTGGYPPGGGYPPTTYPGGPSIPPTTGYPPTGYPPTGYPPTGYPPTTYPPTYPPVYPPVYPPTTVPPYYPPVTTYPPVTQPPSLPPYGGCDNITVPCPAGPPTRPPTTTPPGGTYPPVTGTPPVVQPRTDQIPNDPVRYRVPRTTH